MKCIEALRGKGKEIITERREMRAVTDEAIEEGKSDNEEMR